MSGIDARDYCLAHLTRAEKYARAGLNECPNGPDDEGLWPCDPKGYFGVAECQVCGRTGTWAPAACPPPEEEK